MKHLIQNKWWNIVEDYDKEKLLYLLVDRSEYISFSLFFVWKNNKNQLHRDYDLPSIIHDEGSVWWYKNNKLYRVNNKSTIIRFDGYKK